MPSLMPRISSVESNFPIGGICLNRIPVILKLRVCLFVCLLGFNVILTSEVISWYFDQCAVTHECHAADTVHDS